MSKSRSADARPRLIVRQLQPDDFAAVAALSNKVYGRGYTIEMLRGQHAHFSGGPVRGRIRRRDRRPLRHVLHRRGHVDVAAQLARDHRWRLRVAA